MRKRISPAKSLSLACCDTSQLVVFFAQPPSTLTTLRIATEIVLQMHSAVAAKTKAAGTCLQY